MRKKLTKQRATIQVRKDGNKKVDALVSARKTQETMRL